jgi:hypothetical protein
MMQSRILLEFLAITWKGGPHALRGDLDSVWVCATLSSSITLVVAQKQHLWAWGGRRTGGRGSRGGWCAGAPPPAALSSGAGAEFVFQYITLASHIRLACHCWLCKRTACPKAMTVLDELPE